MSYIRTENGIYSLSDSLAQTPKDVQNALMNKNYKSDETIEELCDVYVFVCEDFKQPQLVIPMNFDYCKRTFKYTKIYGTIWTEWGLKYVAKMNSNGELELI